MKKTYLYFILFLSIMFNVGEIYRNCGRERVDCENFLIYSSFFFLSLLLIFLCTNGCQVVWCCYPSLVMQINEVIFDIYVISLALLYDAVMYASANMWLVMRKSNQLIESDSFTIYVVSYVISCIYLELL